MGSGLDLRETFPGRLFALGLAAFLGLAAVASLDGRGVSAILLGVLIGATSGIGAVMIARRHRQQAAHPTTTAAWALATLAVGAGMFIAGSLPRAVPAVLGFGVGFFAVLGAAAPSSMFRRWSDIKIARRPAPPKEPPASRSDP